MLFSQGRNKISVENIVVGDFNNNHNNYLSRLSLEKISTSTTTQKEKNKNKQMEEKKKFYMQHMQVVDR